MVIVDRASLLFIQTLTGLHKVQEQGWRLLELHSLKIVSSGIIWVSLQEVGYSRSRLRAPSMIDAVFPRSPRVSHCPPCVWSCVCGCGLPPRVFASTCALTALRPPKPVIVSWNTCEILLTHKLWGNVMISFLTGFSDELSLPGSVGLCTPVPTVTTFGFQHLCCVGLRHGGVQDVLPAQSHQTPRLLLQLYSCECS